MKVIIGEFSHETNTFAPTKTTRTDFQERRELFGEEILRELRDTNTVIGGAEAVATEQDIELEPTVAAAAMPGGVVDTDAFDYYTGQIVDGVQNHVEDTDGILLSLHGAMIPEGKDDGEGPIVRRVREVAGDSIPIVATLDLHGNITDELVEHADALVAYETYPHTDSGATGQRAMEILDSMLHGETNPEMHIERPPLIPHGPKENTRAGPMVDVMEKARELEQRDGLLKLNVLPGFHQADVPSMGFSIISVGDGTTGEEAARELGTFVWNRREDFISDYPEPKEGVRLAIEKASANADPIVLADTGDNPGGGGTTRTTVVLKELLEQEAENAALALMAEPDVVERCIQRVVGASLPVTLGTDSSPQEGGSIEVEAYVKAITDGHFRNTGPMSTGTMNNLGRTVLVEVGEDRNVSVILTENRVQPYDIEVWRHVGAPPERFDILVVKSTNHYRAAYEPLAGEVIPLNSPGLCAMDPEKFDYQNITRPKYPLDDVENGYPT